MSIGAMSHPRPPGPPGPSGNAGERSPRHPRRLFYREVVDPVDRDFSLAISLYERAFPPEERATREEIETALENRRHGRLSPDNYRLVVCREGDSILGMCIGRYIDAANIGFVSYLVVDSSQRNRKIGSTLRKHLVHGFRRDAALAGHEDLEAVMGEVEADNPWIAVLVGKRKVIALDVEYYQPPIRPGSRPVPLVLYYQPVGGHEVPDSMPSDKVAHLVRAIFRGIYRIEDPNACEALKNLLQSLSGRTSVGPRDLRAARRALKAFRLGA